MNPYDELEIPYGRFFQDRTILGHSSRADLFEDGLPTLQKSGLRALPVTEDGELVGMLTIEDVGQASLLGPLPREMGRPGDRTTGQETASR